MESGRFRGVKSEAIHEGELRVICRACLNLLHHPSRSTKLRVVLWGVSPLVWRRLLLASDTSIAELHEILKSAFDWSGEHLHRFLMHGSRSRATRSACTLFLKAAQPLCFADSLAEQDWFNN